MMSTPLTRMVPDGRRAVSGSNFRILRHRTLFPQPDSPTMASTSPLCSETLTSRTACTVPDGVSKWTVKLRISSTVSMVLSPCLPDNGTACSPVELVKKVFLTSSKREFNFEKVEFSVY